MKDQEKLWIWLGAIEMHFASMKEDLIELGILFFGLTLVNPDQPIWPVTRSLDRVDNRVEFQNYGFNILWMMPRPPLLLHYLDIY